MLKTSLPVLVVAVPPQVFISMDKRIGKDFEDGLNNLKALAERP